MSEAISYTYYNPFGTGGSIVRSTDGVFIPCDLGNADYQQFLIWVAAGNTPPSGWTGPNNPTTGSSS